MPKKKELTLMPDGRWRKKYHKQIYYFRGNYSEALTAWKEKKAELDSTAETNAELNAYRRQAEAVTPSGEWRTVFPLPPSLMPPTSKSKQPTVGVAVEEFLKSKEKKRGLGQLSGGRMWCLMHNCHQFRDFLGADSGCEITGKVLVDYHDFVCNKIKSEEWSTDYAKIVFADAKQFLKWAYEVEYLDQLPRNFNSRDLTITLAAKEVPTYSTDEVKTLLAQAEPELKLWLLLMLNCGFTQVDINDLHPSEVDWKLGTITRKRSKTEHREGTPTVQYRLWAETFRLLKKYRTKDKDHVLLHRGKPVKSERWDGEMVHKVDYVRNAFLRLVGKRNPRRAVKLMRKTSASMLGSHPDYGRYAQFFLGHAPRSIAERHYVRPSQEQFDKAILWLGEQYGF
jgi:hypothetical protein